MRARDGLLRAQGGPSHARVGPVCPHKFGAHYTHGLVRASPGVCRSCCEFDLHIREACGHLRGVGLATDDSMAFRQEWNAYGTDRQVVGVNRNTCGADHDALRIE